MSCVEPFYTYFLSYFLYVLKPTPAATVAGENLATLSCCEAPGLLCGLQI